MIKNIQQMFWVACVSTCLLNMSNKANAMNWQQQPYNNNNMFNNNVFNAAAPVNPANQGFQQPFNNYPPALNVNIPNPGNQAVYISSTVNIFLPPNTGLNVVENPGFQQPIYNYLPMMPNPEENINPGFQSPYNYPQQQYNNGFNNKNTDPAHLIETQILLHTELAYIVEEIKSVKVNNKIQFEMRTHPYHDASELVQEVIYYGLFIFDFFDSNNVSDNEKTTIARVGYSMTDINRMLTWYRFNYPADYQHVCSNYKAAF